MTRFESARLRRLEGSDSGATSPADALALAAEYVRESGSGELLVVVQHPEGGVRMFFAKATYADAVYLLELAKLTLLTQDR